MEFIETCKQGNLKKVKELIKKVPRNQRITYVNQTDKSFGTGLHYARYSYELYSSIKICQSEEGHIEVVKYLIKKGAKVNLIDKNYWTPLQ